MNFIDQKNVIAFFQTIIERYNELADTKYTENLNSFPVEFRSISTLVRQIADLNENNEAKFNIQKVESIIKSDSHLTIKLARFSKSLYRLRVNVRNHTDLTNLKMSKANSENKALRDKLELYKDSDNLTEAVIQKYKNKIEDSEFKINKLTCKLNELKLMSEYSELIDSLKLII